MTRTRHGADTWLDVLGEAARRMPEKVAFTYLVDGGEAGQDLTYAELDGRARTIGAHLQREGMVGRRVVLWYPSGLEFIAAFLGCLYAGAVAVPAYPPTRQRRAVERVLAILTDAAPSCALTTAAVLDRLPAETLVGGRRPIATDTLDPAKVQAWSRPDVGRDSVAFLQYTSGSTARPRGVVLTHGNLLANSAMIREIFGTSERTRAVSWLPMYHDMGLIGSILHVLDHGGHTTLMSPVSFVQSPVRWLRAISRTRATASGAPNFAYDLCVDRVTAAERAELDLSGWEIAFNGAEPIRPGTLERFARTFASCGFRAEALMPCYGLAEATLIVSARRAGSGVVTADDRVSCGVRPAGVRVEIVDPGTRTPCTPGGTGEIWVAGPAVGQGYWDQEAASAETFRATLADSSGPAFLRTGDLGYLRDGELYVTGRQKDLVIVRGRNHYPQDVEHTVESVDPMLRSGGSAAFAITVDGQEELVALAEVDRSAADADLAALARRVRGVVAAEHDVRPHDVVLIRSGTLPKTSSGKVQRHACREAYGNGELSVLARASDEPAAPARPALPPAGSTARILLVADVLRAEIADLLGKRPDQVDLDEPLVMLGLDSMAVVALQHRVVTRLGIELSLENAVSSTGTEVVDLLVRGIGDELPVTATGPQPAPETDQELPPNQAALWLQHQLVPGSPAHLIAMAVRIDGPVEGEALGGAVRTLAARHDALRTTFPVVDGAPVARVHRVLEPRVDVVDATGWSGSALDTGIARAAHDPLDIAAGPLLRVTLFVRGPAEHRLVITVDHLVSDLWSLEVMLRELEVLYPAGGADDALPAAGSYAASARAQRGRLAQSGEELEAWWRDRLAGAPALLDITRPSGAAAGRQRHRRMRAGALPFTVDPDVATGLTTLAARLGVTRYAVLLGAYQLLLAQWSGRRDVLVGGPAHGRGRAGDSGTVGLFVNMMVLRGRPTPERSAARLVTEAHQVVRDALSHADLPFAHLVERLRPERDPARSPLVQAVLTWQRPLGAHGEALSALALNRPGGAATVGGMAAQTLELPPQGTQFDLVLTVADVDGGLAGRLQYDPDLVDAAAARHAVDHLGVLLRSFVTDPDARLESLPELAPAGVSVQDRAVDAVWDGGTPTREARCVHDLFAEQVTTRPDATAVVHGDETLTYRELDARATALAHRLRAAGAGPGDLVALFLERSAEFVVAASAVLKAGAAYLPLDPAHPAQRRRYVLDDAGPRFAVVRGSTVDHEGITVLDLDGPVEQTAQAAGPLPAGELDRLAYVIYTSGSSGQPKGVPITHRGIAHLFAATADFAFDHDDVWMLFHSCAFDFSVWELWGCLIHGGTLVVVEPEATLSAEAFWDLLHTHGVTVLNQTPAVFREMTVSSPERLAGLAVRHVLLGGEKLEPGHLAAWRAHGVATARLTNMYGLTETSVVATRGPVDEDPADGVVPIGAPLAGTQLCLLDADGDPVGAGEAGEICLSGVNLTAGYLGKPALTASRFTPHPLLPGQRMYRTGDLARRGPDGRLEYLGRADEQVQIRGHRVEPGEIVAALATHPVVRDAVVLADTAPTGLQRLVAYVVTEGEGVPPAAELREHLRQHLPEYMVPGRFVPIATIPVTANGKVDRRALPVAADAVGITDLETRTERQLARLVGEMVALPRIGRDDDLFDLGWHSLLMARLASRIRDEFAVTLLLQDLFTEPTVERIAALIDAHVPDADVPPSSPAITRVDRSRYQVAAGASGLPEAMRF